MDVPQILSFTAHTAGTAYADFAALEVGLCCNNGPYLHLPLVPRPQAPSFSIGPPMPC